MKKISLSLLSIILLYSLAKGQANNDDHAFAKLPVPGAAEKVATFAGGCFWALGEGMSELKGVNKVIVGYAGGTTSNPTYEAVCTRTTGHAESVEVYYNPSVISYKTLAEAFFYAHDPTTLNRQGPDKGTDYRSIAFYRNEEEKKILQEIIKKINDSHHYTNPIVTEVIPFKILYPAENYHQGYYKRNPNNGYIKSVSEPKVLKLRKEMHAQLKPEFQ